MREEEPTIPGNRDSLPVYLTRFVGRTRQREDLLRLLEATRLVTLTGPGGSGKSRLAVQVAVDYAARFPDAVWFADLTRVQGSSALGSALVIAVGSQEQPGLDGTQSLTLSLQKRRGLLLLDSCEHLIDACATLVEPLLTACPELRVLATSIEPLSIPGEATYAVPPLSVPPPTASVEALLESEAGELFVERARLVRLDLDLSARNAARIARICRRLDGLPLALELAAARTRFMPPGELLDRLENSFGLLKDKSRSVLARHQTLTATMKWSHDHLSEPEQVLFRRLSVFVGRLRQDTVEAVCAGGTIARSEVGVLLERLVDKSFLSVEEGKDGVARYRLLRLLRKYGEERMSEAGEIGVQELHARQFATVAEVANRVLLEGGDQASALSRLEEDEDDVTAAIGWASEMDPELAVRLAAAMGYFWRWQGYFSEGRRLLERAIFRAEEGTLAKALALLPLSAIAVRQGDLTAAREHAEKAAYLAEELDNLKVQARANLALGMAAHGSGDLGGARAAYRRVLSLPADPGREMAGALNNLAVIEYDEGHYEEARALTKQALEMLADSRDQLALCQVLDTALRIDLALGDLLTARERAAELVKVSWKRQRTLVASLLDSIAILLLNESRPRKALQVAGAAAAVRKEIGSDSPPPWLRERDRSLSRAREAVGEKSARQLFASGREMSVESALELAGLLGVESKPETELLGELTQRQRQIAALVAQGLTNQQIGRSLRISVRTVDAHLEHIRNRLEVRSRAEIAIWLTTK